MNGIGDYIKGLRKKRGLTLKQVAKNSGIDTATLSRIENGRMIGTLKSHMLLAKSLDIHLPDLYEKVFETPPLGKIPPELKPLIFSGRGTTRELLTSHLTQKKMVPIKLNLVANAKTPSEELPLGSERYIFVLKGKFDVVFNHLSHTLNDNESLYFNASLSHFFVNKLKQTSSCLLITSPVIT
jgi:transcriptional regulator with XRE-family HTH domain